MQLWISKCVINICNKLNMILNGRKKFCLKSNQLCHSFVNIFFLFQILPYDTTFDILIQICKVVSLWGLWWTWHHLLLLVVQLVILKAYLLFYIVVVWLAQIHFSLIMLSRTPGTPVCFLIHGYAFLTLQVTPRISLSWKFWIVLTL